MTTTTYRYGALRWWVLGPAALPGLGFLAMTAIGGNVNPFTVVGVVLLAVTALIWRARVVAGETGLTIVSPLSSRHVAWEDIATIGIVREGGVSYPVEIQTVHGEAIRCFALTAFRTWPVDLTGLQRIVAELEQHRRAALGDRLP